MNKREMKEAFQRKAEELDNLAFDALTFYEDIETALRSSKYNDRLETQGFLDKLAKMRSQEILDYRSRAEGFRESADFLGDLDD